MVKFVNRARMTTPSTGTGTLTLGVALDGFQSFGAAGVTNGDVLRYLLEEGEAWELGTGTYSASGTTLTRSVTESSAGGNLISLTGTATVSLVLTAADLDSKAAATDPRLTDARDWTASTVTQAEAETGTATTRRAWTAQRIRQAILAWWAGSADKIKLDGIAAGAQVNLPTNLGITGTGNSRTITSSTGTNVTIPVATTSTAGLMATGDKLKLDGIAAGAQVNTVTSVAGKTGAVTLGVADVAGAFPTSALPAGSRMLFAQSSAPLGWTKDVSHNNKALRVVSGTAGSGGSVGFTTAFAAKAVNGTIGSTAAGGSVHHHSLSWHEMPAHTHEHVHLQSMNGFGVSGNHYAFGRYIATNGDGRSLPAHFTAQAGASWGHAHGFSGHDHSHTFTGTAIDLAVAYVDIIIATKD